MNRKRSIKSPARQGTVSVETIREAIIKDKVNIRDVIKSLDDFQKRYLPDKSKKYPIIMKITEEEHKLILRHRGIRNINITANKDD